MIETYILTGPPASGKSTRAKTISGTRVAAVVNDLAPNPAEVLVVEEIPSEISLISAYHWINSHPHQFPNLETLILVSQKELSERLAWIKAGNITVERL